MHCVKILTNVNLLTTSCKKDDADEKRLGYSSLISLDGVKIKVIEN